MLSLKIPQKSATTGHPVTLTFCLQVLLTRASLLALAKSILSEYDKQLKRRF